jgi:hypothetical protein
MSSTQRTLLTAAFVVAALALPTASAGLRTGGKDNKNKEKAPQSVERRDDDRNRQGDQPDGEEDRDWEEWRNFQRGALDEGWFGRVDENSDGALSRDEWRGAPGVFGQLDQNRDDSLSRSEIEAWRFDGMTREGLFAELDRDEDSRIERGEWWWSRDGFDLLDGDKNGFVSLAEFLAHGQRRGPAAD